MRLAISVLLAFAVGVWLPNTFSNQYLQALFGLPGTFLHELAHYGFALILNGSPGTFSILPTFSGSQMDSLGHVTFHPNWYNAATVALAPVLVAPASVYLVALSARCSFFWNCALVYAAACGFYACIPSSADLAIAFSEPLSLLLAIPILLGSTWIWMNLIRAEIRR